MYQTQPKYKQKNTLFIVSSSTGKERDSETGFSYFGARYYDSDILTGWLSVDPMADKYPGVSPYAYCAWNPVKLVDPDGEEIRFAAGSTKEQIEQFYKTVKYLNDNNCGGRYGQLKKSNEIYIIEFSSDKNSSYNPGTKTIKWSLDYGLETETGILSPATILNHEMTHATRHDDALKEYKETYYNEGLDVAQKKYENYIDSRTYDEYGESIEEYEIMAGVETRTSRLLGEIGNNQVTRTSHRDGKFVKVENPQSNKKIEQ